MLILLPPSETKAVGGTGPALDLVALRYPELRAHRDHVITAVQTLSRDLAAARFALKVSAAKDGDIAANCVMRTAATMPALERYAGVLYDAMDIPNLSAAQRSRARARIIVISALFGAIGGGDLIPAYRLSAGANIGGMGTIAAYWRPVLAAILQSLGEPVLDLRSGAYVAFGDVPGAISVRVLTEQPDGTRMVVSHFNKHAKGILARAVATPRADFDTVDDVVDAGRAAGLRIEQTAAGQIEILT